MAEMGTTVGSVRAGPQVRERMLPTWVEGVVVVEAELLGPEQAAQVELGRALLLEQETRWFLEEEGVVLEV